MRRALLFIWTLLCVFGVCAKERLPQPIEGHKRLYAYPADSALNTGTAVIVCPGGSYSWLDIPTEGIGVARWLQSQGINAFVLRYRVATVYAYIFWFALSELETAIPTCGSMSKKHWSTSIRMLPNTVSILRE